MRNGFYHVKVNGKKNSEQKEREEEEEDTHSYLPRLAHTFCVVVVVVARDGKHDRTDNEMRENEQKNFIRQIRSSQCLTKNLVLPENR